MEYICFKILCFCCTTKWTTYVCVCVCNLTFGFSSYLGYHSMLSRVPSVIQYIRISTNNKFCRGCGDKWTLLLCCLECKFMLILSKENVNRYTLHVMDTIWAVVTSLCNSCKYFLLGISRSRCRKFKYIPIWKPVQELNLFFS